MDQILIVDVDKSIIESFKQLFSGKYGVIDAYNGEEALKCIREHAVDLIFLDYRIPGDDGLEVLKKIKEIDADIPVIIITAFGTFETIIQSISLGAYDYIEKPLDIDKINILTKRALELKKITKYINYIRDEQIRNYTLKRLIGSSGVMQGLFKKIGRLVGNDVTVLLTGESGTGKELVARAIHYNSRRKTEPFIAVNCSGLTETLLENELFGHEPQAFTGASTKKIGKFEAAGEGTIFLDEIGDMPVSLQTKLLRILQEREFHRLGGIKNIKLKARIITATNKNLITEIQSGRFREDLFYRINVASLHIPPLRERKEDIPELVDYFIANVRHKLRKNIKGISEKALEMLNNYSWPGNVRELENVITNLCLNTSGNIINPSNIYKYITKLGKDIDIFDDFVEKFFIKYDGRENLFDILFPELEKRLIKRVGEKTGYNKTLMAKILGLSRVTIQKKLTSKNQT